ncbi:hypothetical protein ASG49_15625 [Marmoricola sp. Leaf446]|uniref:ATP-binding protein n=1 Tax=Marmoricola sp. Leaf446 TaxID=1736379 RepID=UPI0006F2F761|nr:ATP-binding protein [Marmoricola sp. Leaf446]KQT89225.1 hypothetical protein ASG49_15625 [Marmoricola sp. Leaf446]
MAGETYRLDGLAVPDQLRRLHGLLATAAAEHPQVDPGALMALETAALEVANNVVEHARPLGQVRWRFEVRVEEDRVVAELSDSGEAGDTPWLPPAGRAAASGSTASGTLVVGGPADDLEETGRGLPLAAALLDDLAYRREPGRNVWTMRKALGGR